MKKETFQSDFNVETFQNLAFEKRLVSWKGGWKPTENMFFLKNEKRIALKKHENQHENRTLWKVR